LPFCPARRCTLCGSASPDRSADSYREYNKERNAILYHPERIGRYKRTRKECSYADECGNGVWRCSAEISKQPDARVNNSGKERREDRNSNNPKFGGDLNVFIMSALGKSVVGKSEIRVIGISLGVLNPIRNEFLPEIVSSDAQDRRTSYHLQTDIEKERTDLCARGGFGSDHSLDHRRLIDHQNRQECCDQNADDRRAANCDRVLFHLS